MARRSSGPRSNSNRRPNELFEYNRQSPRPSTPTRQGKVPAQRNKFRVAQAQRQLAVDLNTTVPNSTRAPVKPRYLEHDDVIETDNPWKSPVAQPKPRRAPPPLTLDQGVSPSRDRTANPDLKCPPASGKRKAGSGAGRAFVPWRKDC